MGFAASLRPESPPTCADHPWSLWLAFPLHPTVRPSGGHCMRPPRVLCASVCSLPQTSRRGFSGALSNVLDVCLPLHHHHHLIPTFSFHGPSTIDDLNSSRSRSSHSCVFLSAFVWNRAAFFPFFGVVANLPPLRIPVGQLIASYNLLFTPSLDRLFRPDPALGAQSST